METVLNATIQLYSELNVKRPPKVLVSSSKYCPLEKKLELLMANVLLNAKCVLKPLIIVLLVAQDYTEIQKDPVFVKKGTMIMKEIQSIAKNVLIIA